MDSGIFQGLITILFMSGFVGLVVLAYRPSQKKRMDEFAMIPFEQDESQSEPEPASETKSDSDG